MKTLVARDEAFNFTYRANIDWLRKYGEVQFFSPCGPTPTPSLARRGVECAANDEWLDNVVAINLLTTGDVDLLYLPGGYPELFAEQLTANVAMRRAIKDFAEQGGRIFAECGGFMYLCTAIDDTEMCGVLPLKATMQGAHLHLGYRQMEWNGMQMKGHEFHYSSIIECDLPKEVEIIRGQKSATGRPVDTPIYRYKNVLAGYTHWYLADKGMDDFTVLWQ